MEQDVVWESLLDNRYKIMVIRTGPYSAELCIHDGDQLLHQENVRLSYGALFGPDVADVAEWQQRAIEFVDQLGVPKHGGAESNEP